MSVGGADSPVAVLPEWPGFPGGLADVFRHVLGWRVTEFAAGDVPKPDLQWHRAGALSFLRVAMGADIRLRIEGLGDGYVIQAPRSGTARVWVGTRQLDLRPGRAVVTSPADQVAMRWSRDCRMSMMWISRTALHALLRDVARGPVFEPLRFEPAMDLRTGYGLSWLRLWLLVYDELERPDSYLADPWGVQQVQRTLLGMLLRWQPHTHRRAVVEPYGEQRLPPAGQSFPAYVGKVLELMAEHPEWEHTTSSLARFASISERALQLRFKQHLGVSPMVHLRNTRLDRVHDALLDAAPSEVTLEQVVRRWGFQHYGHFAMLYRQRFQERPSDTLARSRPVSFNE